MRIEQYSHGKLSLIWVKQIAVTEESLHGLIRLLNSRYIAITLTALEKHSELVRRVLVNPLVFQYIASERESITSETLIAAKIDDILSLSSFLATCDARCITFYGLDKELSAIECKAITSSQPEVLLINGDVNYCTSIINDENLISLMLDRSKFDTKEIITELNTLF